MCSEIITISDFTATKLNNKRDIYIYLPDGYRDGSDSYPVLYMHDGQYVFSHDQGDGKATWNINKVADELIESGAVEPIIIVAVSCAERSPEFSYYTWHDKPVSWDNYAGFSYTINGKAPMYEDFLINEVKAYVDTTYRTKPDAENTAMMGASDGGFITINMGLRRPDVFGKLAVMSPALFAMDEDFIKTLEKTDQLIWLDTGEKEACLRYDARQFAYSLACKGYTECDKLRFYYEPEGFHSETYWGKRAKYPLTYFFGKSCGDIALQLSARSSVGLSDRTAFINPVITDENGSKRTALFASYEVSDNSILEVLDNGNIIPRKVGKATIICKAGDLCACHDIIVSDELNATVRWKLAVTVSSAIPSDAIIGIDTYTPINLVLQRAGNSFIGEFTLPTDIVFEYSVKMFDGGLIGEKDEYGNILPRRSIRLSCDTETVIDNVRF